MDTYIPWDRPSPLLDALGGFLRHPTDPLRYGFTVDDPKTNARGRLHAGAIAAVGDVVIGHQVARLGPGEPTPLVTVNLACDLVGSAGSGDWVDVVVSPTRRGRRLGAGTAAFRVGDRPIAHVTALFVPA